MASLSTHLRRPDDHGRLTFHPECPLCRSERLAGSLSAEAPVSRRAQALIAAGVLALSSATPTAVLAAEPDQEQEGAVASDDIDAADRAQQGVAAADRTSTPDFDPNSGDSDLPFDVEPAIQVPTSSGDSDAGGESLEQEPTTDGDIPVADSGDGSGMPVAGQQQPAMNPEQPRPGAKSPAPKTGKPAAPTSQDGAAKSPSTATPPAAATPSTTLVDTSAPPSVLPDGAAPPAPLDPQAESPTDVPQPDTITNWERQAPPKRPGPRPAPATTVSVAPAPESSQTAAAAPQTAAAQPAPRSAPHRLSAPRGDRSHVVQPGDSLWSIARDVLGDGASVAHVAREVNRLWELNGDRIGTGDRDLLPVGTRLVLH